MGYSGEDWGARWGGEITRQQLTLLWEGLLRALSSAFPQGITEGPWGDLFDHTPWAGPLERRRGWCTQGTHCQPLESFGSSSKLWRSLASGLNLKVTKYPKRHEEWLEESSLQWSGGTWRQRYWVFRFWLKQVCNFCYRCSQSSCVAFPHALALFVPQPHLSSMQDSCMLSHPFETAPWSPAGPAHW